MNLCPAVLPFCTQPATYSEWKALKNVALTKLKHWFAVTAWAILLRNRDGDKNKRFNDFFPEHSRVWSTVTMEQTNDTHSTATGSLEPTQLSPKHDVPQSSQQRRPFAGMWDLRERRMKGCLTATTKAHCVHSAPSFPPPSPLLRSLLRSSQTTNETESSVRSAELFRTTFTYPPLSCSNTNKLPIYLYYPDVCHLEK